MLFLLAAGLTLVFGVMDMINLAHGSLYMVGAFIGAWLVGLTGSFVLGLIGAVLGTAVFGMVLESTLLRSLYARDHLSQVLATFAAGSLLSVALVLTNRHLVRAVGEHIGRLQHRVQEQAGRHQLALGPRLVAELVHPLEPSELRYA